MKRLFLSLACLTFALSVAADGYNYLVLTQTDNTTQGVSLRKARSITFTGNTATITSTDGSVSVPLSSLSQISFTDKTPTGVLMVRGTWAPQRITIYNTSGVVVRQFDSTEERRDNIFLNNLPAGVYINQDGTQTRKLLKR